MEVSGIVSKRGLQIMNADRRIQSDMGCLVLQMNRSLSRNLNCCGPDEPLCVNYETLIRFTSSTNI